MRLAFYGGARQVTGANYLLDAGNIKILVDCGLFQGSRFAEFLNYEKFPYNSEEINFVFLTHSHTDHTGRLPKLYKEGFRGKVFATHPTLEITGVALKDNLDLITDEARMDNHDPLFGILDLNNVMSLGRGLNYEEEADLKAGVMAKLHDAGHILGSSILEINWKNKNKDIRKIYFTGDLGNSPTPLLNDYYLPEEADYIVIESAYGSRIHENRNQRQEILEDAVEEVIKNKGALIIPTFSIERTQELLYELNELIVHNRVPAVPIFLDSPLAIKLTEIYRKYSGFFNEKVKKEISSGEKIFNFPGLKFTFTQEESKAINKTVNPKIIIAGSGMSFGGRIVYHEREYLPDPNSSILFIGYQVEGSPGRQILDGRKEVKILGQMVPVRCKVRAIGAYSAHADQAMLLDWVSKAAGGGKLKKVFIVQGEEEESLSLLQKIRDKIAVETVIPSMGEEFELE